MLILRPFITEILVLTVGRDRSEITVMKIKTIGLTLLLSVAAGAMCFANPTAGTWKLNESKSKFGEGAPKGQTVVWSTVGDQEKVTLDGTDASGKKCIPSGPVSWTGKTIP